MKICIYGAGAVGGALGSVLANDGHDLTFIARGENLRKMQEWGLQMITPAGKQTIHGHFTNLMTSVETPDYLLLCVKSYSIPIIEESVNRLTGPDTVIIPVLNGIPWWHFYGIDGPLKDFVPQCLDPKGNLQKYFPMDNVIGSVVYMASSIVEPGVIENHKHPPKFMVGEIDNQDTDRLNNTVDILKNAGFKRPYSDDIRAQIWLKLCWNIAFNPIAALASMNSAEIVEDKDTREAAVKLMRELEMIAHEIGINLKLDIEERMDVARKSGDHKPSMLQDLENGKKLETEAIVGAPLEIAQKLNLKCPTIEQLYSELKAKEKGL
jgi:2-dehydropantoate 2-reductase